MSRNHSLLSKIACILWVLCLISPGAIRAGDYAEQAKQILDTAGVKGGLIVHVGCGDGKLTTALRLNERYLVHGLDKDPACIAGIRERLQSEGLYGPVSVDCFDPQGYYQVI